MSFWSLKYKSPSTISIELYGCLFKIISLKVLESRVFPDAEIPTIAMILLRIVIVCFLKVCMSESVEVSLIPKNEDVVKSIDGVMCHTNVLCLGRLGDTLVP